MALDVAFGGDVPAEVRAAAVATVRDGVRALAVAHGDSVVALPLLISSGAITRVKIPRDLEGLPVRYHPIPLAPHPALAPGSVGWRRRRWAQGRGRGCARTANAPRGPAGRGVRLLVDLGTRRSTSPTFATRPSKPSISRARGV